ncbi:HD-GYP domain-containing protein [Roseococcus sp.]|uniref:HD-GYP domain-containing protein n=1 Tax=Roseococcus sp. TaxID=2109646 RepID=UPI003BAADE55
MPSECPGQTVPAPRGHDTAEAVDGFGSFGGLVVDDFGQRVGLALEMRARRLMARLRRHHPESALHSARVAAIVMGMWRKAPALMGDAETALLGSLLHDVGKLFVPRDLLMSQALLTPEQRAVVCAHSALGAKLLLRLGFPEAIAAVARGHHERWSGGGYPTGLPAQDQPWVVRAVAVADAFDAMTDPGRAYRAPLGGDEALREVEACAGTHFEPMAASLLADSLARPAADWSWQEPARSDMAVFALH